MPRGRPFKKGNRAAVGKGRPPVPEDIRKARKLNKTELERIINKYLHMNKEEIASALKSAKTTAIEMAVGSIIHKAITGADQARLSFIVERIPAIGKVTTPIAHSGSVERPYSREDNEARIRELQRKRDINPRRKRRTKKKS